MAKEYIERGKALSDDRWNSVILSHDRERAREIILCQPAADVVEVVRCKDCDRRSKSADLTDTVYCPWLKQQMRKTDFCSYGERRDNE